MFPCGSMCFCARAMFPMNYKVSHFMHVGDEEKVWMQVAVNCYVWLLALAAYEVANFRLPVLSKGESEGITDPQVIAILASWRRYLILEDCCQLLGSH